MKKALNTVWGRVQPLLVNLWAAYKDNPVATKLAVMAALSSLAIWTPEQLAAVDAFIDQWTPVALVILGVRLRDQVTPVSNPKVSVTVPVSVPQSVPGGASGAF